MTMDDYADATGAINNTINTLVAAGVDPMVVAVTLATASVHLYRKIQPEDEVTEEDIQILFKNLSKL